MIEIVPATKDILIKYYGELPPRRIKAIAALEGDKVLGIGGVHYIGDGLEVFSDVTKELQSKPVTMMKAAKRVMDMTVGFNAVALADPERPTAKRFLNHLGFQEEGEVWRI